MLKNYFKTINFDKKFYNDKLNSILQKKNNII